MAVINSTADLVPAGLAGYAKGIVAGATALLTVLTQLLPLLPVAWQQWVQIVIAVVGAVLIVLVPNRVKPEVVVAAPPEAH